MNDKLKSKEVEQLFKAILSLNDVKECYDFFEEYARLMNCFLWHRDLRSQEC